MNESSSKYDLSFLKKISGGDERFIIEMVNTFKEMIPDFIVNVQKYSNQKNYKALSREAHKFIPGVSFLGMQELEKDLQFIEEYAKKEENLEQLPELVERAVCQINEVIEVFNKEFNLI